MTTTGTPSAAADAARRGPSAGDRVRRAAPEPISVSVPLVGTFHLSRQELGFVGGIVGLAALGLLEWPIALVMAGGQVLAADRSSRSVEGLGEALETV